MNDIVIWNFQIPQLNDLVLIKSQSDLKTYVENSQEIIPRRYLSKAFKDPGVYHFTSPAFDVTVDPRNLEDIKGLDVSIISFNLILSKQKFYF